ncbi:MAG: hypothetical protein ABSA48_07085 [Terracidiphilus sp.]|jgi:hypothetical protein
MTQHSFSSKTEYFQEEGKVNLRECMRIAFETAVSRSIDTIVIFTGIGEGPEIAIKEFRSLAPFQDIKLIAVTFPYGQRFKDGKEVVISPEIRSLLEENRVPLIRAHLPFNPIAAHYRHHGILGQDLTLIGNALSILGGSMSLCVQAAIMACDAGCLDVGDHVISMTSDTAIIVRAAPTDRLLTDFIVREVLCKPLFLTIGKGEQVYEETATTIDASPVPELLPPE